MAVRDVAGAEIGRAALVKLSDPEVTTSAGQEPADGAGVASAAPVAPASAATGGIGGAGTGGTGSAPLGIFAVGAVGGGEPDVPAALAERLVRTGYLKIGKGLFRHDLYVGADQIEQVRGEEIHLKVAKDDLIPEA
jgi:hypothetical protein